jgi:hypothetical protein
MIFCITGLSRADTTLWLSWAVGAMAVLSFLVAGFVSDRSSRAARAGSTGTITAGLFALWIAALATNAIPWQMWWTLAFACAYLSLAAFSAAARRKAGAPTLEKNGRQFRRSA